MAERVGRSVKPVARGKTLYIERVSGGLDIVKVLESLGDRFTGRLLASLESSGKVYDLTLLVEDGKIVAASINDEKPSDTRLQEILSAAENGFIEVQELTRVGVDLDKEFNQEFILDKPISIQDLIETIRSSLESQTTEAREEKVLGEEATTEETAAAEAGVQEATAVEQKSVTEAEEVGEAGEASLAEQEAERVEAEKPSIEEVETGVEAEAQLQPAREVPVEAETVAAVEKTSLETVGEIFDKLIGFMIDEVVETCSKEFMSKLETLYLEIVRSEKFLRKLATSNISGELITMIKYTRTHEDYIRVVINLGEQSTLKPLSDLILFFAKGQIVVAALVDHNNPLNVIAAGQDLFKNKHQNIKDLTALGALAYLVSRDVVNDLLGCDEVIRKHGEPVLDKSRIRRRRGLLSRLFGGR